MKRPACCSEAIWGKQSYHKSNLFPRDPVNLAVMDNHWWTNLQYTQKLTADSSDSDSVSTSFQSEWFRAHYDHMFSWTLWYHVIIMISKHISWGCSRNIAPEVCYTTYNLGNNLWSNWVAEAMGHTTEHLENLAWSDKGFLLQNLDARVRIWHKRENSDPSPLY